MRIVAVAALPIACAANAIGEEALAVAFAAQPIGVEVLPIACADNAIGEEALAVTFAA